MQNNKNRWKYFRASLILAEKTTLQFAREIGVSQTMICLVVQKKAVSARVSKAIDDLIKKHFPDLKE